MYFLLCRSDCLHKRRKRVSKNKVRQFTAESITSLIHVFTVRSTNVSSTSSQKARLSEFLFVAYPKKSLSHSCFSFIKLWHSVGSINALFHPHFMNKAIEPWLHAPRSTIGKACNEGKNAFELSTMARKSRSIFTFSAVSRESGAIYSSNELNLAQKTTSMAGLVLIHPHGRPQLAACLGKKKVLECTTHSVSA